MSSSDEYPDHIGVICCAVGEEEGNAVVGRGANCSHRIAKSWVNGGIDHVREDAEHDVVNNHGEHTAETVLHKLKKRVGFLAVEMLDDRAEIVFPDEGQTRSYLLLHAPGSILDSIASEQHQCRSAVIPREFALSFGVV